jgi:hypothetical protein
VTMEEPCSGIIRSPPNYNLARRWDGDRISPCGILLIFHKWRIYGGVVGSDIKRLGDYLEFVTVYQPVILRHGERRENIPVEMEWMEPIIPIIHRQLNIRAMGIRDRIRLMSIYSRVE